jgi:hypothetical protein
MPLRAGIFVGASILTASTAMLPASPQTGKLIAFDAGNLEAAAFFDGSQAVRKDAATKNDQQAPPLFGMETEPVAGELAAKWRAVEADIDDEQQVLEGRRAQKACPAAAQSLLDIVAEGTGRSGVALVGLINGQLISPSRPLAMRRNGGWWTIGAPPIETSCRTKTMGS